MVALLGCIVADPDGLVDDLDVDLETPKAEGEIVGRLHVPDWVLARPFLTQDLLDTLVLGFKFLQMVVINHTVGKKQLEVHRDFIGLMLGTDFGVVNTYSALFTDNDSLLRELQDEDFRLVTGWMSKMHHDDLRGATFIDLLGCLTTSNQQPIPANQNSVLEIYVQEQRELMVPLQHAKGVSQICM